MRDIYRVTKNKQFKKVRMSTLIKGDLFYMEEPDGELVVDDLGNFIFEVTTPAVKDPVQNVHIIEAEPRY